MLRLLTGGASTHRCIYMTPDVPLSTKVHPAASSINCLIASSHMLQAVNEMYKQQALFSAVQLYVSSLTLSPILFRNVQWLYNEYSILIRGICMLAPVKQVKGILRQRGVNLCTSLMSADHVTQVQFAQETIANSKYPD